MADDEWGQDPSVRYMRHVFASMAKVQDGLLTGLGISPLDRRLRRAREGALRLFEKAWARATREGIARDGEETGALYAHCLAQALTASGIGVPPDILPRNQKVENFLKGTGT